MVPGADHDADPRRPPTDKFLADLETFANTPTGSPTIILLGALVRLVVPGMIKRRAHRHKKAKARIFDA